MKLICKIRLHPLFYLVALIGILTGLFKEFLIFMLIIIIHELGHIICGLLLKQKIDKIIVLPFGSITFFHMPLNIQIYKELMIALSGPLMQIIGFLLLRKYISNFLFTYYNIIILTFNLLPIYPLDGSKIFNCLWNKLFCFKVSFYTTMWISFITIFITILIIPKYSLILLIIYLFLIIKTIKELLAYPSIYNKFLFERYYQYFHFKKIKYINNIYNMYKNKRHIIKYNDRWLTEKEILRKRFDFKRNIC